ncbi:MAG: hypothetical protein ACRECF_02850 [Methyloceanibacter sp.]
MILDLSLQDFTTLHVAISLIAIIAGLIVVWGMLHAQRMPGMTALFLVTTILTSVTGFLFPVTAFTPALGVGIVSIAVLAAALLALYAFDLNRAWRWVYVIAAVLALYLNVFVLVVQGFLKVPALHWLAPNGNEPAFIVAQTLVLLLFTWLGTLAVRRFHPELVR